MGSLVKWRHKYLFIKFVSKLSDNINMKASGTEPDTLPSSPDLSLATFTGCPTPQAQFPTQAELAFVSIWSAHMMLPMKRVSKMLGLLFPEGVIKEFSWRPTSCPAGELLPAQTLSWKGIHSCREFLNISSIPTVCRDCSFWSVYYDPSKEMTGTEYQVRGTERQDGASHSPASICKIHRREAEPPSEAIW